MPFTHSYLLFPFVPFKARSVELKTEGMQKKGAKKSYRPMHISYEKESVYEISRQRIRAYKAARAPKRKETRTSAEKVLRSMKQREKRREGGDPKLIEAIEEALRKIRAQMLTRKKKSQSKI